MSRMSFSIASDTFVNKGTGSLDPASELSSPPPASELALLCCASCFLVFVVVGQPMAASFSFKGYTPTGGGFGNFNEGLIPYPAGRPGALLKPAVVAAPPLPPLWLPPVPTAPTPLPRPFSFSACLLPFGCHPGGGSGGISARSRSNFRTRSLA